MSAKTRNSTRAVRVLSVLALLLGGARAFAADTDTFRAILGRVPRVARDEPVRRHAGKPFLLPVGSFQPGQPFAHFLQMPLHRTRSGRRIAVQDGADDLRVLLRPVDDFFRRFDLQDHFAGQAEESGRNGLKQPVAGHLCEEVVDLEAV